MNGVILYQSKYGATRKYAQWLFAATNFDLLEMKQAKGTDLSRYEVIVFGGGIYASGIAGLNALKKQLAHLSPQRSSSSASVLLLMMRKHWPRSRNTIWMVR